MNSRSRSWMATLRDTRAKSGIAAMPTATMALVRVGRVRATMTIATRTVGKPCTTSVARETTMSSSPPSPPAKVPSSVPITPPISTTMMKAWAATRVALSSRLKTSRPSASVPSR